MGVRLQRRRPAARRARLPQPSRRVGSHDAVLGVRRGQQPAAAAAPYPRRTRRGRTRAQPPNGMTSPNRPENHMHGYTHDKDNYLRRLRRIEGQVRGLQRMIDEDKYCIDILTQVAAATKALQSVALGLLEEHLSHCVAQAVAEGGDGAADKVREASDAIARLVRS